MFLVNNLFSTSLDEYLFDIKCHNEFEHFYSHPILNSDNNYLYHSTTRPEQGP